MLILADQFWIYIPLSIYAKKKFQILAILRSWPARSKLHVQIRVGFAMPTGNLGDPAPHARKR